MKKSHRVAHENQRRGGFCYYYCTISNSIVKNSFSKIQVNPSRSTFQFPRFLPPVQLYIENISSPACCSFSTLLQSDEFPKMHIEDVSTPWTGFFHFYADTYNPETGKHKCFNALNGLLSFLQYLLVCFLNLQLGFNALSGLFSFLRSHQRIRKNCPGEVSTP